jgi:hypothetical protein
MRKEYRIHPAIGIARVGDAARGVAEGDGWFIGPEIPGAGVNVDANGDARPFKSAGFVKAQAQRFRIWEYIEQNGVLQPAREMTLAEADVESIEWEVEVANRKAAFFKFNGQDGAETPLYSRQDAGNRRNLQVPDAERQARLVLAPGAVKIGGASQPAKQLSFTSPDMAADGFNTLGELRTDSAGRLIFLGGHGRAVPFAGETAATAPIGDYANNNKWFDDVSDGPVRARIKMRGAANAVPVDVPAWIMVGPPDFGPAIRPFRTMFDTVFDLAVRDAAIPIRADDGLYAAGGPLAHLSSLRASWAAGQRLGTYVPSFKSDLLPILAAAKDIARVHSREVDVPDTQYHDRIGNIIGLATPSPTNLPLRRQIVGRVRNPDQVNPPGSASKMPWAWGDLYGAGGTFGERLLTVTRLQYAMLEKLTGNGYANDLASPDPTVVTPAGLDRAALENAVGGGFYPGIEGGWLMARSETYKEPFRVAEGKKLSDTAIGELRIGPGFFSQQMALPWQADFLACKKDPEDSRLIAWWPTQRPDDVFPQATPTQNLAWARGVDSQPWPDNGYQLMVANWSTLGFVVHDRTLGAKVEVEGPEITIPQRPSA